MKSIHLLSCLLASAPLAFEGCSGTGDVKWGEEAGGGARQMAEAGAASGASVRTGSISTEIITGAVAIIAEHEATLRQRQVAVERGRAWSARHIAPHEPAPAKSARHIASHHPTPAPAPRPRYIAVDTEPDSHTAPKARKSVMIFDTEAQQIVGKNVYDVQTPPEVGTVARFETYSAQYVGPGN